MNRIAVLILALLCVGCAPSRDVARLEEAIPASPAYTHLVFRAYVDEFTVSIGGRRVYAFRDVQSRGRLTVHIVPLPQDSAGKRVEFDVPHPTPDAVLMGARYLATAETLPFAIDRATLLPLRENADDIVLGFIFAVVGAIACGLSLIRRRGDTLAMGSFGAFTLLYGLRLMVDSSLPYAFGFSWRSIEFTEAFITYIIPIAGWALPLRLIGPGWKSSLRWQVIAFTIFAPIGIISDIVTGRPFSLEVVNNVLVIIGGINIIVNLLLAEHRRTLELRVLLAGSAVFMLFALNNNLTNLGLLPWRYDAEAPGFVLFVAALGFAATRAFTRGERESLAIDNELRTAREIQQSILPRAMPQRSGLRFDAAYLPATSVGGDMYSFLDRDDGAGVLVADVAGHGVPAALIASMVKIAVSTQARVADDPAALIGELNAILRRDVRRAFVTATYLWLDVAERRVVACNAGHPPPLLLRNGTFLELGGSGVLLGRFEARYVATSTPLEEGDRIVAYTDGIPEARNARGEMFGEERLRELMRDGSSAQEVVDAVRAWRGDTIEDDLTIVMMEWNAGVPRRLMRQRPALPPARPGEGAGRLRISRRGTPALLLFLLLFACGAPEVPPARPHILLVTLDTTRADAIGANTPSFNALAKRSRNFRYAYATAPQTLPSHSSMLTGLYPGGHRVHENARYLDAQHPLVAEKLQTAGYRTAAFVSAFPLARRFGLARGFETYDEPEQPERNAQATTDRAIAWLPQSQSPTFLWVHYYDPHFPYVPDYAGEIKSMDAQLGRLLSAYEKLAGDKAIIVVADHGESLGEHGEAEHGNLLYQSVMHVPLLVAGPGVKPEAIEQPVSTRRVFHTILDFAGIARELTLRETTNEVVVGEAMGPFLQYGWLPQVMAVEGRYKAIFAGLIEVYDVVADPAEQDQFGSTASLTREMRKALLDYPVPSLAATPPPVLDDEARKRLASLGYITADTKPVILKDAPRPRDMTHLFEILDQASSAFVRGDYASAIPLLERVVAADPHNVTSILRIAAAHSALGHNDAALAAFRRAEAVAPNSPDVRHYLALHYARTGNWNEATPLLERVIAENPDRLLALEALAESRQHNGRIPEALQLWRKIHSMRAATPAELARVGQLAMAVGDTALAIESFERAGKGHDLELGVLYLASRRFAEARDALDRVPASHPEYPMALFKRAQVSVLLNEPDRAARIAKAKERADETTRALIESEMLFRN